MKKLYSLLLVSIALTHVNFAQSFDWSSQNSGVTTHLRDVFFVDNQTGWAVGNNGVVLATTDGGQNWTAQTSGTTDEFRTVFFIDANIGWAASFKLSNKLFKTTNGGATWTDITPSNIGGAVISDIAFGNAMNGWMEGDSIYKTTDGGTTWAGQSISSQVSQTSFRTVTSPTDSTAYVGGSSKRNTPSNTYADAFSTALSPTSGVDFMNGGGSMKTTDLGIRSIDYATPNIIFAGGSAGAVYKMEFQGQNNFGPWDINLDLNPASGTQFIHSISFPTTSRGMFLTQDGVAKVYHTADTGINWNMTPDTIAGLSPNALHAPDAENAWIVGANGMIYKGIPSAVGINEVSLEGIKIYPNPVKDNLVVELGMNESNEFSYRIVDISGKALSNGVLNTENKNEIDVSNLQSGIYILMIENQSGISKSLRFNKL